MKKLKVLHIIPSYFPADYWGGPVFSTYGLNNAMADNPLVELRVLTTDSAGPNQADRIDLAKIDMSGLFNNYSVLFTRRVFLRSTSLEMLFKMPGLIEWADVVHISATYSFPVLPGFLICRIKNKPLVWSPCGAILDSEKLSISRKRILKSFWEKMINALILPGRMVLHATSEEEKEISILKIPRANSQVIPRGVLEPTNSTPKIFTPSSRFKLLFLSRLDPKKGLENLLDALSILNDPSVTLRICGSGDRVYVKSLEEQARNLGLLDGRVVFAGQAVDDEKEAAFSQADVFILPSHSESFGVAIAEALAHGLPVIASRNTPWQGLEKNKCGLWVDNDPQSLVSAIRTLRQSDLQSMSQNGRSWISRDFSWKKISHSMLALYQSLVIDTNGSI